SAEVLYFLIPFILLGEYLLRGTIIKAQEQPTFCDNLTNKRGRLTLLAWQNQSTSCAFCRNEDQRQLGLLYPPPHITIVERVVIDIESAMTAGAVIPKREPTKRVFATQMTN